VIDTANIDHAIVAHSRWKERLRAAIAAGECEVSVTQARRDDACDLGRWLRSLPATGPDAARIAALVRLHAAFHREAAQVLQLALSKQKTQAEAAMASGSPFIHAATDLIMALTEWKVVAAKPSVSS
jgi:methyl-accepting chemotaxis protein